MGEFSGFSGRNIRAIGINTLVPFVNKVTKGGAG